MGPAGALSSFGMNGQTRIIQSHQNPSKVWVSIVVFESDSGWKQCGHGHTIDESKTPAEDARTQEFQHVRHSCLTTNFRLFCRSNQPFSESSVSSEQTKQPFGGTLYQSSLFFSVSVI